MSAVGQERVECRAFGVVPNAHVTFLANVLRGLCIHHRQIDVQEWVLTMPLAGGAASTQLRISRPTPPKPRSESSHNKAPSPPPPPPQQEVRWRVQHEGLPMCGAAVAGLPAAVREITESTGTAFCTNTYEYFMAAEYFKGLGAKHDHTIEKKGNEYICIHEGYELQVDLIATTVTIPGSKVMHTCSKYIVDVRTRVRDGQHVAAAQCIGSFAAKLAPLVTLQPAAVPIT